jgi:guanine deaminase
MPVEFDLLVYDRPAQGGSPTASEKAVSTDLRSPTSALLTAARFIDQAIDLAVANTGAGNAPFGAVVVRDGQILGTGVNAVDSDTDPFAHAEVAAMRDACRRLGTTDLTGAVVVSSCEPCVLCRAAAAPVGVRTTIHAATRDDVPQPGGGPTDLGLRLAQLADALHAVAPGEVVHVPTPRASEPFTHYLDVQKAQR